MTGKPGNACVNITILLYPRTLERLRNGSKKQQLKKYSAVYGSNFINQCGSTLGEVIQVLIFTYYNLNTGFRLTETS